jgi:hypothetical protein
MDKSLCWLKFKSRRTNKHHSKGGSKKKSQSRRLSKNYNSQLTCNETEHDDYSQLSFEIEDKQINLKIPLLYNKNKSCATDSLIISSNSLKSYMFNPPSMSSSRLDDRSTNQYFSCDLKPHSTPQPLDFDSQPQFSSHIYDVSFISLSSLSSQSTPISKRSSPFSRLSFGVTSSPMLPENTENDLNLNYFDNDIYYDSGKPKTKYDIDSNYESQNEDLLYGDLNESLEHDYELVHQQKLIDHINNVRLGLRKNNQKQMVAYNYRNKNITTNYTNDCSNVLANNNSHKKNKMRFKAKSRKLQKIFQSKLQKQLREIKNWQSKVKTNTRANEDQILSFNNFDYLCENNFAPCGDYYKPPVFRCDCNMNQCGSDSYHRFINSSNQCCPAIYN